jgi:hypothetical protein
MCLERTKMAEEVVVSPGIRTRWGQTCSTTEPIPSTSSAIGDWEGMLYSSNAIA